MDERWLTFYMRGKITEKRGDDILDALELYITAVESLKDQGYYIPKRIQYNTPPDAALEMLEIYYRINASILKLEINDKMDSMSLEEVAKVREILEKLKNLDIFTRAKAKSKAKSNDSQSKANNKSNENKTTAESAPSATTTTTKTNEDKAKSNEDRTRTRPDESKANSGEAEEPKSNEGNLSLIHI